MQTTEALAILELDPGASPVEVQAAWRRLARVHHPDRSGCPQATARMARLNAARVRLLDEGPVPGAEPPRVVPPSQDLDGLFGTRWTASARLPLRTHRPRSRRVSGPLRIVVRVR